nr:hypothetical protein [Bradyrhizobium cytisi]
MYDASSKARKVTRRDLPRLSEVFRGYLLPQGLSVFLHADLGNAEPPKRRAFDDARALGVYPDASADQLGAKPSREVAPYSLRYRYGRCGRDSGLIGQRRRENDRAAVVHQTQCLLNVEIGSAEIDVQDVKALLRCFRERAEFRDFGIGIEMSYDRFAHSFEAG